MCARKKDFKCIAVRTNNALACLRCDHPDGYNCPVDARIKDRTYTMTGAVRKTRRSEHGRSELLGAGLRNTEEADR